MLFEVAMLLKPTKNEAEEGKGEALVMKPTAVVAADAQSAAIIAVLDHPFDAAIDRTRLHVLVRPFA